MKLDINVNKPQSEFLNLPHKFRAFVAGFGSGKTYVGCIAHCLHFWRHPGVSQAYYAPTYTHIRDIFFPTISEVAELCGLTVTVKSSDKEVLVFSNGKYRGKIICRSLDRPEFIIGYKSGYALIDEFDVMDKEKARLSWRKIIARMRYNVPGVKNGVDITTTPEGFRFVYELFVENLQENPALSDSYGMVQASTYDNAKNLPDDYINSLLETYPSELISAYLNGQFVNLTSGTVFYAFNRKTCTSEEEVKEKEPLYIGMDFNVGKMAAVVYVRREKNGETEWHAVDEFTDVFDTPAMISAIRERYRENTIKVYPDSSGKNRKAVDASQTDISLLQQAGFSTMFKKKNPFIKDRILAANKSFQDGKVKVNIVKCTQFVKGLEKLPYDKNGVPDKTLDLDHATDAGTYLIAYEMPVNRPAISVPITFPI